MVMRISASVETVVFLIGSCNLGVRRGSLIHIQEEVNFRKMEMNSGDKKGLWKRGQNQFKQ